MKTFFFLFILFLFSFPLYSEVNNEDQFIETGKLLYKKNEIGITLFTGEYYEKDKYGHWETTKYVNGRKHGPYKSYYNSGIIEAEGNYKNGNMDGLWKWYHYFAGVITDSVNYKNGVRHGLKHIYWGPDQIMTYENYNNGKLDGEWFSYYENGQVEFESYYKDGDAEGYQYSYYENGQLESKVFYKNGKEEGLYESYYESGYYPCCSEEDCSKADERSMTVTSYDLKKRKMSYKRSDGFLGFCTMMKNETVKCSGSSSDTKATYKANEDGLVSGFYWLDNNGNMLCEYKPM